ncbi:hypothetical protein BDN72DRAFT_739695, partial [Pluteus cervinus]
IHITADPGIFNGDKNEFPTWYRNLKSWLLTNEKAIPGDDQKILAALSRIRGGNAGVWANMMTDRYLERERWSWNIFTTELVAHFEPYDLEISARDSIESWVQGQLSIDAFMDTFETLMVKGNIEPRHAVYLLRKHVDSRITNTL